MKEGHTQEDWRKGRNEKRLYLVSFEQIILWEDVWNQLCGAWDAKNNGKPTHFFVVVPKGIAKRIYAVTHIKMS